MIDILISLKIFLLDYGNFAIGMNASYFQLPSFFVSPLEHEPHFKRSSASWATPVKYTDYSFMCTLSNCIYFCFHEHF